MKKNTFYSILFIATMVTVPFLAHFPGDYETAKAEAESVTLMYEDYGGTDDEIHKSLHKEFPKATCEEIEDMMFDNRKAILKDNK